MFVKDLMTGAPITITGGVTVIEALNLMKEKSVRRLPVLSKDGQLVGIVSEKDLLYASPSPVTSLNVWEVKEMLHLLTVNKIMSTKVITIDKDAPLEDAAVLMSANKISGLPVLGGKSLVGIITETDLFKAFLRLLGGKRAGVRITVVTSGAKGIMAKISNAIFGCGGKIVGLGMNELDESGKGLWAVTFKIQGAGKEKLLESIRPVVEEVVDSRDQ
ncbi:A-adding tRNA nucleotidyltransferase [uncultured bacterium]|nr:A-adding tRNA nucleotidyltransferase [uncultured bacterium]